MVKMAKKILIGFCIIALLFIGIHRFLSLRAGNIDTLSSIVMYPFLVLQKEIVRPIAQWRGGRASYKDLVRVLGLYIDCNEDLQRRVIELQSLLDYKKGTQELRQFASRYKTDKAVLAQVLFRSFGEQARIEPGRNVDQPLHFFLIDAGERQGIMPNMIVVYKNCLIGRISEVYPYYSKVILITDKLCKVAAYCTKNSVQGIHEGTYRTKCTRLSFVNHLDTVEQGDLVLSSGEGLIFPRGFGLGYIKRCEADNLHHAIEVEPLLDLTKLDYCYVLQKGTELEKEKAEEVSPALPLISQEITTAS